MSVGTKFAGLLSVGAVAVPLASGCAGPQAISPEVEAELAVNAVARACGSFGCDAETIYVRDELHPTETASAEEAAMPALTKEAIEQHLGQVEFVDRGERDALFGDDALVDGGRGVLISVGPVEHLNAKVVGIEVGVITARDGGYGAIFQFQWTGIEWDPATSDETGVTVTSWVS